MLTHKHGCTVLFVFVWMILAPFASCAEPLVPKAESEPELGKKRNPQKEKEEAAGIETISLKTKDLKSTDSLLTPLEFDSEDPSKADTIILPKDKTLIFRDTDDAERLILDGTEFQVVGFKNKILKGKKTKAKLKPKGLGLKPVTLKTDKKQRHTVAFPMAKREEIQGERILTLYYRSGCAQFGKLDSNEFCLYDQNVNARYTKSEDVFTFEDMRVFAPLADIIAAPKGIYHIEKIDLDGSQMKVRPYADAKGTVSFSTTDRNISMEMAFTAVENPVSFVATGDTKMDLPADTYTLACGVVRDKKKDQPIAFLQTAPFPGFTVEKDKTVEVKFGKPYKLQFTVTPSETGITIGQKSLSLIGCGGEQYVGIQLAAPPKVLLQIGNDKPFTLGAFGMDKEYRPTDFKGNFPKKDKKGKELKGKVILRLEAKVRGFGEVEGSLEYNL